MIQISFSKKKNKIVLTRDVERTHVKCIEEHGSLWTTYEIKKCKIYLQYHPFHQFQFKKKSLNCLKKNYFFTVFFQKKIHCVLFGQQDKQRVYFVKIIRDQISAFIQSSLDRLHECTHQSNFALKCPKCKQGKKFQVKLKIHSVNLSPTFLRRFTKKNDKFLF